MTSNAWKCSNCGLNNPNSNQICASCSYSYESSIAVASRKTHRRMCPVCFHRHQEGVYCHMFCQGILDDNSDEYISEYYIPEENSEGLDDDDLKARLDNSLARGNFKDMANILKKAKEEKEEKIALTKPLPSPAYISSMKYVRCNCKEGVPKNSRLFEPVQNPMKVGPILVMTFDRILATEGEMYRKFSTFEEKLEFDQKLKDDIQRDLSPMIPLILSYLRIPECNFAPLVNTHWNRGTQEYRDYIDLRDCAPIFSFRPHTGIVEGIVVHEHIVFTAGNRKVIASDYRTGSVLAVVANTSGDIPALTQFRDELFYSDSHGAIRSSMISHDPANMMPGKTLWEHSRGVTNILWGLPSVGPCHMHGVADHVCTLVTCSEDRSVKVWNVSDYETILTLDTHILRTATFQCMTQSGRHLFVGTSTAKVAVFTKHNVCERSDVHSCNVPGAQKAYCLQVTLKLPDNKMPSGNFPAVTQLMCAGPNYEFSMLWAGDSQGQLTIWRTPHIGINFIPLTTWKGHEGAVRGLGNTWRHAITIGDDGLMVLYDLTTLERMRRLDVMEWCRYRNLAVSPNLHRQLHSLCVNEDLERGGTVLVGTSFGDVITIPIGTRV